ncbi:hypothetical protein C0995_007401 [Termitomyces sp. Mi166|nr:hypothetical protein C0995_007401 [Termitomyces sp. Mi166\
MIISRFLPIACVLIQPSWSVTLPKIKRSVALPDLYEASIAELQAGLDAGHFSSVDLVKAYFARIEEVNLNGPALRAVIETNPSAIAIAETLDIERKTTGPRSALHGIPVLLKDNIATIASEGMNTTAGSFSLLGSVVPDDAGVVKRLRKAGAIILGKANLSEFAEFRGNLANGWSGRGGQSTNAYFPNADPCGSSSGSGISTSIGLAAVTLGTETDGSITCPSSRNNIAGIKPTVGLTSRANGKVKCSLLILNSSLLVIPISEHQDTVGPMTRSITDAAIVLSIIAGPDPNDNFTLAQPQVVPNFTQALKKNALKGKRIGVPRQVFFDANDQSTDISAAFEEALVVLRGLGATVVDPADLPSAEEILVSNNETVVLDVDFKARREPQSLISNPSGVRSLADLIAFNNNNPSLEKPSGFMDQSILIESEATNGFDDAYFASLAADRELGGARGIDAALQAHNLDALVLPSDGLTTTPAVPLGFFSDNVTVERAGPETVYPAPGVPFGLSFLGTAFSEFDLIGFAYAYEQKTQTRLARKAYPAAIPQTQLIDILRHDFLALSFAMKFWGGYLGSEYQKRKVITVTILGVRPRLYKASEFLAQRQQKRDDMAARAERNASIEIIDFECTAEYEELWYEREGRSLYLKVIDRPGLLSGNILRLLVDIPPLETHTEIDGDTIRTIPPAPVPPEINFDDDIEDITEELQEVPIIAFD